MAQLLIRNLPDETKATLRRRAAHNGRSMEAEARAILVDVVAAGVNDPVLEWLDAAAELRASGGGATGAAELELPERTAPRKLPEL